MPWGCRCVCFIGGGDREEGLSGCDSGSRNTAKAVHATAAGPSASAEAFPLQIPQPLTCCHDCTNSFFRVMARTPGTQLARCPTFICLNAMWQALWLWGWLWAWWVAGWSIDHASSASTPCSPCSNLRTYLHLPIQNPPSPTLNQTKPKPPSHLPHCDVHIPLVRHVVALD